MAEHVGLLRSSKSDFIQELFAESNAELAEAAAIAGGKVMRRGTKSAFKLNSVGAQFRKQLQVPYSRITDPIVLVDCLHPKAGFLRHASGSHSLL